MHVNKEIGIFPSIDGHQVSDSSGVYTKLFWKGTTQILVHQTRYGRSVSRQELYNLQQAFWGFLHTIGEITKIEIDHGSFVDVVAYPLNSLPHQIPDLLFCPFSVVIIKVGKIHLYNYIPDSKFFGFGESNWDWELLWDSVL